MTAAAAIKMEVRERWPDVVGSIGESAKVIAFNGGITPRAVEQMKAGLHGPSLATALSLRQHYPMVGEFLDAFAPKPADDHVERLLSLAASEPDMGWHLRRYYESMSFDNGIYPDKALFDIEQALLAKGRI